MCLDEYLIVSAQSTMCWTFSGSEPSSEIGSGIIEQTAEETELLI